MFLPSAPTAQPVSDPRLLALRLLATSGAWLALAGARLSGEDGAALTCALRDLVLDADVDPIHWPVDEARELLRRPAGHPDAQVDRLVAPPRSDRKRRRPAGVSLRTPRSAGA